MKLTEMLAIYAACLSTFVFIWNVAKGIPRYKVDLLHGVGEVDGEHKHGIYVSVRNSSSHTVHLANISLLYPYRTGRSLEKLSHIIKYRSFPSAIGWCHTSLSNYEIDDKCPLALEPGKSHMVFIPEDVVERVLGESIKREIKAVVQDQLWRNKYSPIFQYPRVSNI